MYAKGHCGVSLLVYAPVGLALAALGAPATAVTGGAVMLALAMLPDCDHCLPRLQHRGPTHSLAFALAVGAVLALATTLFVTWAPVDAVIDRRLLAFGVGTLAVVAHLVADLLTPMGVAPFWPVSTRRYSLDITPAKDPTANAVLLGTGLLATALGAYLSKLVA